MFISFDLNLSWGEGPWLPWPYVLQQNLVVFQNGSFISWPTLMWTEGYYFSLVFRASVFSLMPCFCFSSTLNMSECPALEQWSQSTRAVLIVGLLRVRLASVSTWQLTGWAPLPSSALGLGFLSECYWSNGGGTNFQKQHWSFGGSKTIHENTYICPFHKSIMSQSHSAEGKFMIS